MRPLTKLLLLSSLFLQTIYSASTPQNSRSQCQPETFPTKPQVFILSDIYNEPDDTQSLVRFLLYSNQFSIHGIIATTSYWLNSSTNPEAMFTVVDAYEKVVDNLNYHAGGYPSPDFLRSKIASGPTVYGMAALSGEMSRGAEMLIAAADAVTAEDPLWVLGWGGANTLAQALDYVRRHRTPEEARDFVAKLRVYTISDQDDAGAWIRLEFPKLMYICSIHGWNHYRLATWTGISGEGYNGFDNGGPDTELVSAEWLKEHIQIGELGAAYPNVMYIMEGDTPSFLGLIQNGLNTPERPEWGGWGGRYVRVDLAGRYGHYADAVDWAVGKNGMTFGSNQASIWRWREAFQNDFAGRMQWTLSANYSAANHPPVVEVNGTCGNSADALEVEVLAGSEVVLDASGSWDPDGGALSYTWWHYKEPTATQTNVNAEVASVNFTNINGEGSVVKLQVPERGDACVDLWKREKTVCMAYHVVLEVEDDGSPRLKQYKRILIQVRSGNHGGFGVDIENLNHDEL